MKGTLATESLEGMSQSVYAQERVLQHAVFCSPRADSLVDTSPAYRGSFALCGGVCLWEVLRAGCKVYELAILVARRIHVIRCS